MNNKTIDDLSPREFISYLVEHIDENGALLDDFDTLHEHLKTIASVWNELCDDPDENRRLLGDDAVFKTWQTYVRAYDLPEFDCDTIRDIGDRAEIVEDVKDVSRRIAQGEEVAEYDKNFLGNFADVTVCEEEYAYYEAYREAVRREAALRLDRAVAAEKVISCAWRVCRLLSIEAPQTVVDSQLKDLAKAMFINRFCTQEDI